MIKAYKHTQIMAKVYHQILPKKKTYFVNKTKKEDEEKNYLNSNFNSIPNNSANRVPFPLHYYMIIFVFLFRSIFTLLTRSIVTRKRRRKQRQNNDKIDTKILFI